MSAALSADAKDALARDMPDARHCRDALLDGLVYYGAARGRFVTHRNAIARLFRSLVRERASDTARIETRSRSFAVPVPESLRAEPRKPAHKCDRIMEARAALLACGSIASGAHGYHLEFVLHTPVAGDRLAFMLRSLGREPKRALRKGRVVLYYKDFDAIAEVLTATGAFGAVLQLEGLRALRETKNRIHRLVNTEAANLERSAGAAAAQQRTIRFIASAYGLANLTAALREIAELRMANPEESLAELGRRCNPPIGKPTVNSRLMALARLERRLKAPPAARMSGKGTRARAR